MNKARVNYWVDVATGLAFVMSAVSGIVFLLPSSLADGQLRMLGVSYQAWNQLHTWSSLAMVAGALIHVALHWQWVVSMTKKTLRPGGRRPHRDCATHSRHAHQTAASAPRWARTGRRDRIRGLPGALRQRRDPCDCR